MTAPGRASTAATAVVEIGVAVALGLAGYERYRHALYRATVELGLHEKAAAAMAADSTPMSPYLGFGAASALSFVLTPLGLLVTFLFFEGMIRLLHVVITGEGCGFAVVAAARALRRWRRAPPPDRVHRFADGTITIEGAPRSWDALTTFEMDGRYYVLADRVELADVVRYTLAPAPDKHLIRGVVHLDRLTGA